MKKSVRLAIDAKHVDRLMKEIRDGLGTASPAEQKAVKKQAEQRRIDARKSLPEEPVIDGQEGQDG